MGIALVSFGLLILLLGLVWRYARERLAVSLTFCFAWVAAYSALSLSGVLARVDVRPPPFVFMLASIGAVGFWVGRSGLFAAVPLWLLVAVQGFRLPLELVMHQLARSGVMPMEMSYSGYNFDIVSGASAFIAALVIKRTGSRRVALLWNILGSVLLVVIVSIAVLASPVVQAFGDGPHVNRFVAEFPYVFLPTVCVAAALTLHIAVFKRLRAAI
jgi:hypothetical protein